jgi:hypothetical protein
MVDNLPNLQSELAAYFIQDEVNLMIYSYLLYD